MNAVSRYVDTPPSVSMCHSWENSNENSISSTDHPHPANTPRHQLSFHQRTDKVVLYRSYSTVGRMANL